MADLSPYTLEYFFDALSPESYSFQPIMQQLFDKYAYTLPFRLVYVGEYVGDRQVPVQTVTGPNYAEEFAALSHQTHVYVSDQYVNDLVGQQNYLLDSVPPAIAQCVYRSRETLPARLLDFAYKLQSNIFGQAHNPNQERLYHLTGAQFDIDGEEFLALMRQPDMARAAQADFDYAQSLGIERGPQVRVRDSEGSYTRIADGYQSYDELDKTVAQFIKHHRIPYHPTKNHPKL